MLEELVAAGLVERVVDTDAVDIATIIPLQLSSEAPDPVTSPTQAESAERVVSLACLARAAGIVGPAYLVVVDSQLAFGQLFDSQIAT